MKEFMYIFRDTKEVEETFANLSPQDMEQYMKQWNEWMARLAQQERLIGGQPLFPEGKVVRAGKKVTDGPFIEGKDLVGGYLLIKAKDFDEAIALSEGCPMYNSPTGTVEIRGVMQA